MKYRKTAGGITFTVFNHLIMIFFALICLMPIWHTLCASFSMPYDLGRSSGLLLWPAGGFTTEGYALVLNNKSVWTGYLNTIINVGLGTLLGVLLTFIAAYVPSLKILCNKIDLDTGISLIHCTLAGILQKLKVTGRAKEVLILPAVLKLTGVRPELISVLTSKQLIQRNIKELALYIP